MGHSVFIIGNGFDLNLGLKTSYKNYISSTFFRKYLGLGHELFDYLDSKNTIENWIDIEKELAIFSKDKSGYASFMDDYLLLCETLNSYICSLDISSLNKDSEAYKFLINNFDENTIILNFNYTGSVDYILGEMNISNEIISHNIKHIHGSVKDNNIIFGVDDRSKINLDDTFLYKSTNNNYSGRRVKKALEDFNNLIIFGHSLGESDHMYFESSISSLSLSENLDKTMKIYYYENKGKYQIYKQLHKLTTNSVSELKDNMNFEELDISLI